MIGPVRTIEAPDGARGFTVESAYFALMELMEAGLGKKPLRANVRALRQNKAGALVWSVAARSDDNEGEVA